MLVSVALPSFHFHPITIGSIFFALRHFEFSFVIQIEKKIKMNIPNTDTTRIGLNVNIFNLLQQTSAPYS